MPLLLASPPASMDPTWTSSLLTTHRLMVRGCLLMARPRRLCSAPQLPLSLPPALLRSPPVRCTT
jgi:hypothetical protein